MISRVSVCASRFLGKKWNPGSVCANHHCASEAQTAGIGSECPGRSLPMCPSPPHFQHVGPFRFSMIAASALFFHFSAVACYTASCCSILLHLTTLPAVHARSSSSCCNCLTRHFSSALRQRLLVPYGVRCTSCVEDAPVDQTRTVQQHLANNRTERSQRLQKGRLPRRSRWNTATAGFFLGRQGNSEGTFLCNWPNDSWPYVVFQGTFIIMSSQHDAPLSCCPTGSHPIVAQTAGRHVRRAPSLLRHCQQSSSQTRPLPARRHQLVSSEPPDLFLRRSSPLPSAALFCTRARVHSTVAAARQRSSQPRITAPVGAFRSRHHFTHKLTDNEAIGCHGDSLPASSTRH